MTGLEYVLIAVITSGTTVGLLAYVVKHYFKKSIDLRFQRLEKALELQFARERKLEEELIERRIGAYAEIVEVCYKLRKLLEAGVDKEAAYLWDEDLSPLCLHLTQHLYRWRIILPDSAFDALHEFKRIFQDILVFHDIHTRQEMITDHAAYASALPGIRVKLERVQRLYEEILSALSVDKLVAQG